MLGVALVNYSIAKITRGSVLNPILTWTFNLSMLFCVDYFNGFSIVEAEYPFMVCTNSKQTKQT